MKNSLTTQVGQKIVLIKTQRSLVNVSSFYISCLCICIPKKIENLGPVVQSIVSLTSLLRGQLVKCFTTLLPNILIFFVEKMREAFALQKLLTFFQQKIMAYLRN